MSAFVTGATGFIGRYLIKALLARGDGAPIYILVRRESRAKLEELRRWWGADEAQVVCIEGDLGRPALGVSEHDLARLRGVVTHVFHLGAVYDIDASNDVLESANVGGASSALTFARAVECKCFHLCSSIASAGRFRGVFTEDMFEEATGLDHPYFRTKHDAEALVRNQTHTPWRIYRPGMVIGNSHTGHITKIDGPYYFFKMLQLLRRHLPNWLPTIGIDGGYVNVVPVDYVASAMAHLAYLPGQDGRCFHLTDPQPRTAGELLNVFARAGHAPVMGVRLSSRLLDLAPHAFSGLLQNLAPMRAALDQLLEDFHVPRSVLQFLNLPTLFDNRRARELLEPAGLSVPRLEEYAWRVWDYWERHLDPDLSIDRSLSGAVKGKCVLITGGSSGIGKATAFRLAEAGAKLLLVARDPVKLQLAKQELEARGAHVFTYACDLTDEGAVEPLVAGILAEHGAVDILINNAGRSIRRSIAISYDRFHDYERLMRVNYFAAVRLTLALLPHMVERRRGHVIVVSSIGVLSNAPRFSAYIASKAALEAFTRCASSEYRDVGVKFTVVNMPLVRTPMVAPTRSFEKLNLMSTAEAAGVLAEAVIHKPSRLVSRLGVFAQLLEVIAPRYGDVINNEYFHMFPDSAAARGDGAPEEAPTKGAIAFTQLMKELRW